MTQTPTNSSHASFVGSIPEHYDRCLGPLLFEHYAVDLAGRIDVPAGGRVLELACGTGIATSALRATLPAGVEILATDLNEAMLQHARGRRGQLEQVRFEPADAQHLTYADAEFDAVACQFGWMFLPDQAAGMREAARVLRPGGQFVINVWDSWQYNPSAQVAHEVIAGFIAGEPPGFLRVPFGHHRIDPFKDALLANGFEDLAFDVVALEGRSESAHTAAVGFVQGSPMLHEVTERASASVDDVTDAVAERLVMEFGDAPMRTPLQAIVISARRPRP